MTETNTSVQGWEKSIRELLKTPLEHLFYEGLKMNSVTGYSLYEDYEEAVIEKLKTIFSQAIKEAVEARDKKVLECIDVCILPEGKAGKTAGYDKFREGRNSGMEYLLNNLTLNK